MSQQTIAVAPFGRTTADRDKFLEHAQQNTGSPPFARPSRCLSTRPRAQQRDQFYPAVLPLPDLKDSSSNQ